MLSIIVPYRDAAPYLGRCCESLLQLTGDGYEFVLVDDNHKPEQICADCEIVMQYAEQDERFQMYFNELTPGVSGARNTGIDRARGEWVTFLDADDELLPEAGWAFETAIKKNVNVYQMNHRRYYTKLDRLAFKYVNVGGLYDAEHLPRIWFGVWNKVFRAYFLRDNDIRFLEGLQYGEDGLFVLECLAADGKIYHADKDVTAVKHRFDNQESLSHRKTLGDLMEQIEAYEYFFLNHDEPKLRSVICDEIAKIWTKRIKKIIE